MNRQSLSARFLWLFVFVSGIAMPLAPIFPGAKAATASGETIDFSRQIRPILSDNCFACHGPDEGARKAGFRLDHKDDAFKGGKSGAAAIVPGKPDESELMKRILTSDEDDIMPPPKSKKSLKPEQIELLRQWISQGATWQSHWAFEKPQRPKAPEPTNSSWARNAIDRFVLARLEKEGLNPSPEADKPTLVRRASLDLTGLPPTIEEVDAFLADKSPGAYESLVDRLLASSRYGEHMAKFWLDAARYADSHGFHIDSTRDIWAYREWVISAFNKNLPFDQFTREQLAGDLLPNATTDQKVASGYVRCNMSTGEGGAIEAEYQAKYTFDRTETTGTIWMGLTLTCSRCHTHKYDPITHHEYYGLYSFFNNLNEPVMDGNRPNPDPFLQLPTPRQKARQEELKRLVDLGQRKIDSAVPELDTAQVSWQSDWHRKLTPGWSTIEPAQAQSLATNGASLKLLEDHSILAGGPTHTQEVYEVSATLPAGRLAALRLEALPDESLPEGRSGRGDDGRFRLSEIELHLVLPKPDGTNEVKRLNFANAGASAADKDADVRRAFDGNADTGWSIDPATAAAAHHAIFVLGESVEIPTNAQVRVKLRFPSGTHSPALGRFRLSAAQDAELVRLLIPAKPEPWRLIGPFKTETPQAGLAHAYDPEKEIDFGKAYPGVREEIRWNARPELEDGKRHLIVHELHGVHGAYYFHRTIKAPDERKAELRLKADDLFKIWVNDQLVVERSTPALSSEGPAKVSVDLKKGENKILIKVVNHQGAAHFAFDKDLGPASELPADVAAVLAATDQPLSGDRNKVRDFYRREYSPEFKQLFVEMQQHRSEQAALEKAIPTTMVAREMDKPRETVLFMRGEYDKPGDKVSPGVPAILPPLPAGAPSNRLGFAEWLLSPEHPLTARVTVNRFWQQFFGIGLVKTTEDFGVQGERPSHPELLDWLATEFQSNGWDMKKLQRLIVTSATYRQVSRFTPDLIHRDPENRLLARGPRFRVDAEGLRDMALFMGDLLLERIGGSSVKPYEPPGLWEAVSFNNSQKYVPDEGEGQYRRGLYTYWKRQSPPPNMLILDAPTREYCVVRRPRTNTPLQALALLNDPQFVEASRAFAGRILSHGGATTEERIRYAFRIATARPPTRDEIELVSRILTEQLSEYRANGDAAEKLLNVGSFKVPGKLDRGELAAWTTIAGIILNLDETITKS